MADEQPKEPIVYTAEELATIGELTKFFLQAPGQVALDANDAEEGGDTPEPTGDALDLTPMPDEGESFESTAPKRPVADLTKFDDILGEDPNAFDLPAASEPAGLPLADPTDVPLDQPVDLGLDASTDMGFDLPVEPAADLGGDVPIDSGFDLPAEPTADTSVDLGGDDLGAPGLDDFSLPSSEPMLDAADTGDFALPGTDAFAEPPATDFGNLDLPPATSEAPAADDLGGDFSFDSAPSAAIDAAPAVEPTMDLGDAPDLGGDFNFDSTPTAASDTGAAPADDAFNFDSSAPSLDDLSPEVALGGAAIGGGLGAASLSSDLSSLAEEQSATVDPATLRRVRDTLRSFPVALRRRLSKALLDENMKGSDSTELMRLLSEQASANEINAWLDSKNVSEVADEVAESEGPRIIMARPEYTDEGLARQERVIKLTRFGAIAAFVLIALVGGLYFSILKPLFYRQAVAKGRDLILERGSAGIPDAEKHFEKALSYYDTDAYAFLQFADAYRYKGLYSDAFAKLFGEVKLPTIAAKVGDKEVRSAPEIFGSLKRVPVVSYGGNATVTVNGTPLTLGKKGAYVITHLDNKKDEAQVLLALGSFHSNPSRRFSREPFKNNFLGADYYRRVLMSNPATPSFKKEEMMDRAVMGIGDIFYHEKDFDRSLDYYKKILDKEPTHVAAHAGAIKALLKLATLSNDPRMVIQHHTMIKSKKVESKLPMYLKARLAAFYIDLPAGNELRVKYNITPQNLLTGQQLKTRADDLLNSIFVSEETDAFGIKREGAKFAEGYYQRARQYAKDQNQVRMALKQFEYAFHYDSRHFMALNDRAELLTSMNDYAGAMEVLKLAKERSTPEKLAELGENEQDETLSEAPVGLISFNMGKAMYLDAIRDLANSESWLRLKEVQKYRSSSDTGAGALLAHLDRIEGEFEEAQRLGLTGSKAETELMYFSGWSKFVRGDHRGALSLWEKIDVEKTPSLPNLSLAQSHCYYRLAVEESSSSKREKYLDSALGLLFYSQDRYTNKVSSITRIDSGNAMHSRLVSNLAIIENNIGAIYEMLDDEQKALLHYWKSVENSKRIGKENEIANLNIRLSFKRKALGEGENTPLIMDYVAPLMDEL